MGATPLQEVGEKNTHINQLSRHSEGSEGDRGSDEPPAAALQDRRGAHAAFAGLYSPSLRKPGEAEPLYAASPAPPSPSFAPHLMIGTTRGPPTPPGGAHL